MRVINSEGIGASNAVRPKWTMTDVARLAKVSVKTVSRVLNNEPAVNEETRRRVQRVVEDLGYQPHAGARSLRGRAPDCVGVTFAAPHSAAPLSQDLVTWIFVQAYRCFGTSGGYVCFDFNPFQTARGDYARGLWERLYRGLIITGPIANDDEVLRRVHYSGHPYIALGRLAKLPELSSAAVDYAEGSYLATKHLIDLGHKSIGLLTNFEGYQAGEERKQGYMRALDEAGLQSERRHVEVVTFRPSSITQAVHHLASDSKVTAIVDASGTEDGASIREGAWRAGRQLGPDLDIVTWSYTREAAVLREASAQVWVPLREAVIAGLRQFADWYNGLREGPVSVLFRPMIDKTPQGAELDRPQMTFGTLE